MIRRQVRSEKFKIYDDKLKQLNFIDNSLFDYSKSLKRKNRSIPPLKVGDSLYYSDQEKAEIFARSFKESFSCSQNVVSKFDDTVSRSINSLDSIISSEVAVISQEEIKSTFHSLNPRKAAGQDGIGNQALLVLSNSNLFVSLCSSLFNACLRLSYFPKSWKVAKILPIPKSITDRGDPDKFRPISLLSCLGKSFEKILLNRLNDFETESSIFIKQQCGFRSQHSTTHQVLRISEDISFGFNKNKSTAMVLLDLRKAFDSVWHDGLIHQLLLN